MLKIAKTVVIIVGLSIAFLGLLAGVLYSFSPFSAGGERDLLRVIAGASFITLGGGLGLPLAWQGMNSLRGRPSRLFRPRPARLLVPLFVVTLICGQVVLALDLAPALTFPLFYILSYALPPLFFLTFVGRRLTEGDTRWRDVVLQLASGAFLATFAALGLEAAFVLLSMVVVLVLAALMPNSAGWAQELSAYLQDPRWLQSTENLSGPLPSLPILIALGVILLIVAPVVEEMFKPLGVALMKYRRPTKAQSFLWGLTGGAGFALAEGLFNGTTSLDGWAGTVTLRVGATAMHCLGGGLVGLGWYYLFATRRPWRLLGTYATSVGLHSLWNAAASGVLLVSLSMASSVTDEIGLTLGGLVVLGLMAFLSLLALSVILVIFYLTKWLRAQMPAPQPHNPRPPLLLATPSIPSVPAGEAGEGS